MCGYRPKSVSIPDSAIPPDWRELSNSLIRSDMKPSRSKIRANTSGANNLSSASKISNCMNLDICLLMLIQSLKIISKMTDNHLQAMCSRYFLQACKLKYLNSQSYRKCLLSCNVPLPFIYHA